MVEGSHSRGPAPFWWPDTRTFIVGWMCVSCFVLLVLFWWKPPDAQNALLNTLMGAYFTTGFGAAIAWWMGSSKGSDDKSDVIATQLPKAPPGALGTTPPPAGA